MFATLTDHILFTIDLVQQLTIDIFCDLQNLFNLIKLYQLTPLTQLTLLYFLL